jgi:glycerol-3-phosphate cytidylyltransferase
VIVYTGGTFDLLHVGHLELLGYCRLMAGAEGRVVASLNRDEFVKRYKGHSPVQPYAQRAEMLRACRLVDLVVCNVGDENSGIAIDVVQPDLLVIGDDWRDRDYLGQLGISEAWLEQRHLRVSYVPRTRGVSTTELRGVVGASGQRRLE